MNKKEIELKSQRFSSKIYLTNTEKEAIAKKLQIIREDIEDLENNCDKIDKKILKLEEKLDYEDPNKTILEELTRYYIDRDILATKLEELREQETKLSIEIGESDD